jgi:hypothetical protein
MLWGRDCPCTVPPPNTPEKPRISLYEPCFERKAHNYHPAQKKKFYPSKPFSFYRQKRRSLPAIIFSRQKTKSLLSFNFLVLRCPTSAFMYLAFPFEGEGDFVFALK